MKYLVIIPARGGSKGIPRKNIKELRGKPLIYYSISAAMEVFSKRNDAMVIVSTDDEEIKRVALRFGAEVPFLRPKIISNDKSASIDYVFHALNFFQSQGEHPENIIILQPTSPLRTAADIQAATEIYEENCAKSLISVYKEDTLNEKIMYRQEGMRGLPIVPTHNAGRRRQEDESVLVRNGAMYVIEANTLIADNTLVSNSPYIYIMPKVRSINIDTPDDFLIAEGLIP